MANRFVTEIHANTYDLRLSYPEGNFISGKERSEMAISSDDHIFISSTSQDPSYYKGYIVKMDFNGNVVWQLQINDNSSLPDVYKGTCVGSLYPTLTGGVICPLQFSTEHLGYNRQYNGVIELDSSGNVINQNGFFHYDPTYNPLAPADNIRPAINLRPVINSSCTKMLSATTAYYNGFAPICNTINSSLVFGAKVIWNPLYWDTDFLGRYYTPTFIGDTFASLTPRQDMGIHYIIAKTSGTVMLFARRISSSIYNTWIAETPEGGVICAGRIYLGQGYAFKLDSDLNFVWGRRFGSSTGAIAAGCITDVGYCMWGSVDGVHTIFNLDTDGNLLFARKLVPSTGYTWDWEQSYMRYTPSQGVTLVSENALVSPSRIRVSQFPSDLSQSSTCSIFGDVTTLTTSGFTPTWDTVGPSTSSAAASFDLSPNISTSSIGGSGYTRICFEADVTVDLSALYDCNIGPPLPVSFTATILTGTEEPPFTYEFDFGDGSPIETYVSASTSLTVIHNYADFTTHTCTVTVTNNISKSASTSESEDCPIVVTVYVSPYYRMYLSDAMLDEDI